MGDYTAAQIIVYACPPEQVQPVLDLIDDYGLAIEFGMATADTTDVLELGRVYGDAEARVGIVFDSAAALAEAAPDSVFVMWEDPKYEWLGSLYAHAPALGDYSADCDADGQPVLGLEQIMHVLDSAEPSENVADIRARFAVATGKQWFELGESLTAVLREHPASVRPPAEAEEVPAVACYSDHGEDIRTKGDCDYCQGTT